MPATAQRAATISVNALALSIAGQMEAITATLKVLNEREEALLKFARSQSRLGATPFYAKLAAECPGHAFAQGQSAVRAAFEALPGGEQEEEEEAGEQE